MVWLSIAKMELAEAVIYYDENQPGVGKRFTDAIEEAGERICRNPGWWPVYESSVRGCRVFPFPYRLLYRELPDRIQIVALHHFSRRPGGWKHRLN
jgi:plasmid stabilization system protein ParE